MSEFLEFVFSLLQRSLILVLIGIIAAGAVIGTAYFIHRRKYKGERKFPWGKVLLWLAFFCYLIVVLYATMLRWGGFFVREWNLHLFRAWREAWNNFSAKNWANVLLNIAMFVPLGVFLPLLGRCFRKWYWTVPVGIGVSLTIELLQLATGRGICDVDDLFCNALGAAVGYFGLMAILSLFNGKGTRRKPALVYGCLTLIPVAAIGGIVVSYHVQEYGNLPEAAAYRVNLGHLEWKIECELPDTSGDVPVYRTQTVNKEACDAFADRIAGMVGEEVDMVSYYQEMAYYNLTNGIVMIYYHDGSYEIRVFNLPFDAGGQTERDGVEKLLESYDIAVPEEAEFSAEDDGWYSFTCNGIIKDSVMLDGTLRVRGGTGDDHAMLEIENHLIQYSYHGDAAVLSPEEACQELKKGGFAYADAVKRSASDSVTVVSCTLDYAIDTKGFYQPVYIFEIRIPQTGNTCLAMIPAMKG